MASQQLITSRDYDGFDPPLAYDVVCKAQAREGGDSVLIRLRGSFDLSSYGLSAQEQYLIIAPRHKDWLIEHAERGETVSVNIYRARRSLFGGWAKRARNKDMIAWGEVFCVIPA
tara:strand:+ start:71306 stop:71650 length:345 start_codon:yes stop_codon:yes gene_type:complete